VVVDLVAQQPAHLRLHCRERARQQVDVAQGAGLLADGACGAGPVGPDVGDEEADQQAEDEPERGHQARAERTQPGVVPPAAGRPEHDEDEHHGQLHRREDRECQERQRCVRETRRSCRRAPFHGSSGM